MLQKKSSKLKKVFIGVLFLLIIGGVYIALNIDSLVKDQIERVASATLGVPVTINRLHIAAKDLSVSVKGIKIGNPSGFKNPYVMTLGGMSIAAGQLTGETIVLNTIDVNGLNVFLEAGANGTNLGTIKDNMTATPKPVQTGTDQTAPSNKKLIIRDLTIKEAKVMPTLSLANKTDSASIALPDIHLTNLGDDNAPVTPPEAIVRVFSALTKTAVQQSMKAGILPGVLEGGVKKIGDSLKGLFN